MYITVKRIKAVIALVKELNAHILLLMANMKDLHSLMEPPKVIIDPAEETKWTK